MSSVSKLDWRSYVDADGNFELPTYLHKMVIGLLKSSLDLGTILSSDPAKTRAYKEQLKQIFKRQWIELAQALEEFGIIVPCGCPPNEFCKICHGARYILHAALSPDRLREISVVTAPGADPAIEKKLAEGLAKALEELSGS